MPRLVWSIPLLCAMICAGFAMPAGADELADKGRAILEANRDNVVTVRLVIKQQFAMQGMSQDNESKSEISGTIIDPSGLTVVALSALDPSQMLQTMMESMGRDDEGFKISSQVTDLKLLFRDGTEIPGQVVLRDKDLDLGFIRPKDKVAQPMKFLDLSKSSTPSILDPVITVTRLGRVAGREYAVAIERVESIVSKPRTFYVPGNDPTSTGMGSPVFSLDGSVIGFMVVRQIKGGDDDGGGFFGMMNGAGQGNTMGIIVTTADVAEVAKQAPEKAEEPPAEEQPQAAPEEGEKPSDAPAEPPADAPKEEPAASPQA
ncbi:MAG: serine protease [Candidatus Hydrogenedentes bacterium]|nr:serine protease [Candidatus Hydrogenedentota bacterium]